MIQFEGKDVSFCFNNPKIDEMLKNAIDTENRSEEKRQKKTESMSASEMGESIIAGYWLTFFSQAKKTNDFSYEQFNMDCFGEDIKNLFQLVIRESTLDRTKEVIAKTIAAYLYGLAMNEENCGIYVSRMRTELTAKDAKLPPLWANAFSVKTGKEDRKDFLEAALESLQYPVKIAGGLYLNMKPFVKAYKKATGVDLSEKGIGNIAFITE